MRDLDQAISWLGDYKAVRPEADKQQIQAAFTAEFRPRQEGKLFVCGGYAVRFCHASGESFSNTVLALSKLRKVDHVRAVVCVVRPDRLDFMMMNATLLAKVGHSSSKLRVDNVKGSFNGTDIYKVYDGLPNEPSHFDELFAMHSAFTWDENLERLVAAIYESPGSREVGRREMDALFRSQNTPSEYP